ncbi:hypothetical protein BGW42_005286 [Actinomortierella wolfii]|nr:hypothetical protein BGW42_005286 [Actinomortierella wolfii]
MSAETTQDKESQIHEAYFRTIIEPLQDKYEDTWEEETYWNAVAAFKAECKKIGYEDPIEYLGYPAIPCIVLIVDNVVRFAGNAMFLEDHMKEALNELYPVEE